jgi:hypothetical protein
LPGSIDPRGAAGLGEDEQRQEGGRLGRLRQEAMDHPRQIEPLPGEIGPHQLVAERGRMPGGVDEVDHLQDGVEPRGQVRELGDLIGDARDGDLPLGARDPRLDRRLLGEERLGDLGRRQPADQPQGQGDLRLPRQGRVAAGEDQPEPVVGEDLARSIVGRLRVRDEQGHLAGEDRRAAVVFERPARGHRGQPRAGSPGDPLDRPVRQGLGIGVLHAILARSRSAATRAAAART